MPEGDTLHIAAQRVSPALVGSTIERIEGSHRGLAANRRRLVGSTVTNVEAVGKHLLIHTDAGWTLRTHLGMPGWWTVYQTGERWKVSEGKVRVAIYTADAVAICVAAPTVEIAPTVAMMQRLERLGPDLTALPPPYPEAVAAALRHRGPTVADVLLDQSVAAGVGNVYKSEILFIEGIHPWTPPDVLEEGDWERLFVRAHRLLAANVRNRPRSTTGNRGRDLHWVYGRSGKPCRRCDTTIEEGRHGQLTRFTTWCPSCQPPATRRPSRTGW